MSSDRSIRIDLRLDIDTQGLLANANLGIPQILIDERGLLVTLYEGDAAEYGFGLAEVVTISIVVGSGVASDLVASSIKAAVRGVIRRVHGSHLDDDGTVEGITRVIDEERVREGESEASRADSPGESTP